MQYLYYLTQIGLALCPMSNNALFVKLKDSPVGQFFRRGLRVSLCTDDPMQFHQTESPLIEEYLISAEQFGLNNPDKAEIARNSVLISRFDPAFKRKWIGEKYDSPDPLESNDPDKTNVPNVRLHFRHQLLLRELHYLAGYAAAGGKLTIGSEVELCGFKVVVPQPV